MSANLAAFAANLLGIFIVQLFKNAPGKEGHFLSNWTHLYYSKQLTIPGRPQNTDHLAHTGTYLTDAPYVLCPKVMPKNCTCSDALCHSKSLHLAAIVSDCDSARLWQTADKATPPLSQYLDMRTYFKDLAVMALPILNTHTDRQG